MWLCEKFFLPKNVYHNRIAIELEEAALITYFQLEQSIQKQAKKLRCLGIEAGDRVAFTAGKNTLDALCVFFALISLGASPCPLNPKLPEDSIYPLLIQKRFHYFLSLSENICAEDVCMQCKKIGIFPKQPEEILLFTSGSSGSPKLVCLTWDALFSSAVGAISSLNLDLESSWLLLLPLFHVSGLGILFRSFACGSRVHIPARNTDYSFCKRITHLSLVPTQLIRLLRQGNIREKFPSLRCLLLGGAPIGKFWIDRALATELPIRTSYGMTETASLITLSSSSDSFFSVHAGKSLPLREISLAKDGEILVKGSTLFSGYDQGKEGRVLVTHNGWFATKDLGTYSADGHLIFIGRKDNLFISGGENLYPEAIERAIEESIQGVLYTVVVPIFDEEFGQKPVAFIQMDNRLTLPSKEEFYEKLTSVLPKFAFPQSFYPFPSKYLSENSKVKRSEIQTFAESMTSSSCK